MHVSVSDPVKHEEALGQGYILYKVASGPGGGAVRIVQRRYSDFVWLAEALALAVPGCIIPSLPPKTVTWDRFGTEFVQSRRRGLEKFLQRICSHMELSDNKWTTIFLQSDEAGLKEAARLSASLKPKRWTAAAVTSKWNEFISAGNKVVLEKDASQIAVDEVLEYISAVETLMNKVVDEASQMTEKGRKAAFSLKDLSHGLIAYGLVEGQELGKMLTGMGDVTDSVATLAGIHASSEVQALLEPLAEQARVLKSVKDAISIRNDRRSQYSSQLGQLESLQAHYTKLLGQPGKESAANDKERKIVDLQKEAEQTKTDLEHMTARLLHDFGDFQSRKCEEMQATLLAFTELQVRYHQDCLTCWQKNALPILKGTNTKFSVPANNNTVTALPEAPTVVSATVPPISPAGTSSFGEAAPDAAQQTWGDVPSPMPTDAVESASISAQEPEEEVGI